MDTSPHQLTTLFDALGLPSSPEAIAQFLADHALAAPERIDEAPFWTPAQRAFLQTALAEDADWAQIVDQLALLLSR